METYNNPSTSNPTNYNAQSGTQPGVFENGPSGKSRGTAGLLALLLGGWGIHYFYSGQSTAGLYTLLINLVGGIITCGLLSMVMSIVLLIQAIMLFTKPQEYYERNFVNIRISTFGEYFNHLKGCLA